MVVSKKSLPLIGRNPVERETGRGWTAEFAQTLDGRFPTAVTPNLELPSARYRHFHLVAILQVQGLDRRRRQANGKTVSPLRLPPTSNKCPRCLLRLYDPLC
jgi:hypothetical protein